MNSKVNRKLPASAAPGGNKGTSSFNIRSSNLEETNVKIRLIQVSAQSIKTMVIVSSMQVKYSKFKKKKNEFCFFMVHKGSNIISM